MVTEAIFVRQEQARQYIAAISDPTERLLTEAALSRAIGAWVGDPVQRALLMETPIDLLAYARGTHAFFRNRDLIQRILNGECRSVDDIEAF
jgi:hypothetical protein